MVFLSYWPRTCPQPGHSPKSLAEFPAPQGGKSNAIYFFAGSAGEKILISPGVPGPARRGSDCNAQILKPSEAGSI